MDFTSLRSRLFSLLGGLLLLVVLVFAVFGHTVSFDLVDFDDLDYLNALKRTSFDGVGDRIEWAFTYMQSGDWQPVIWLSWMLDQKIHGLSPAGLHFVNVLFHAIVTCLFFICLRKATRRPVLSLLAALFFAIHPLRVESVAWISERKDMFGALFMFLTLIAYYKYTALREHWQTMTKCLGWYAIALLGYAIGLMSKPMLVSLPLLMLLIDFWPLQRWKTPGKFFPLLAEKIPFAAFAAFSCMMTYGAIQFIYPAKQIEALPWSYKLSGSLWAYGGYLQTFFFPQGLTFYYPRPLEYSLGITVLYGILLLGVTGLVLMFAKRKPYLLTGWGWFVLTLIPVSGIVRIGSAVRADRYTYFAHLGLCLLIAWLAADLVNRFLPKKRGLILGAVCLVFVGYAYCAFAYSHAWRNAKTLNEHGIKVSDQNYRALNNLGNLYLQEKDYGKALELFEKSVKVYPDYWKGYRNMGLAYFHQGNETQALVHLSKAVKDIPDDPVIHHRMADIYRKKGNSLKAIHHYEESLKYNPSPSKNVFYLLGNLYGKTRDLKKAEQVYLECIRIDPQFASCPNNLASVYLLMGNQRKAKSYLKQTLAIDPNHENAKKMLSTL